MSGAQQLLRRLQTSNQLREGPAVRMQRQLSSSGSLFGNTYRLISQKSRCTCSSLRDGETDTKAGLSPCEGIGFIRHQGDLDRHMTASVGSGRVVVQCMKEESCEGALRGNLLPVPAQLPQLTPPHHFTFIPLLSYHLISHKMVKTENRTQVSDINGLYGFPSAALKGRAYGCQPQGTRATPNRDGRALWLIEMPADDKKVSTEEAGGVQKVSTEEAGGVQKVSTEDAGGVQEVSTERTGGVQQVE
ncbi:hypothetical protein EYF80_010395 [Liparis tanakae]|uniref:Uncharacterized protein n=1 Tax=Liparis tanakae TaxID=230148 RepID=A0A4Z2INJ6_9TELE|nr:hypothetical protein EYF80_010395 [Liparis tanakae]